MLPVVYTPPSAKQSSATATSTDVPGIYLSVDAPETRTVLGPPRLGPDEVDLIVATDAQAILGIGGTGVSVEST